MCQRTLDKPSRLAYYVPMMHGNDWTGQDVAGWWCSEKLDGWRAIWTGTALLTRNGNKLDCPAWFTEGLPVHSLDGEIWAGRGKTHDDVHRAVATRDWRGMRLAVWDIPEDRLTLETAQERLQTLSLPAHVEVVSQTRVESTTAAHRIMRQIVDAGGEGIMLRKPGSPYLDERTDNLLKMKP